MKLDSVALKNFRCFRDELVSFGSYTAIVGPNNSGKSTVFKAVDLFFRTTQKSSPLVLSDFNDPKKELRIALSFVDIPEKAQAPGEFGHYYRHGKLEFFIRAKIQGEQVIATVHGQRLGIRAFTKFYEIEGSNERKAFYHEQLRPLFSDLPDLPQRNRLDLYEAALIECESRHSEQHEVIESGDLAFGNSGVASRLKKYVDWVYIPAVKDASEEDEEAKNNAFGILINRIIRARVKVDEKIAAIQEAAHEQIKGLADNYRDEVGKLESVLDSEFRKITSTDAHVHLDWTDIGPNSVSINPPLVRSIFSDNTFRGEISRFGHGLQRNYLMTLVHLTAKLALDEQPSIILACEEPELYQHPPQARYLHAALQRIAKTDQVLITTHSPHFISAKTFESVRVVRKSASEFSKVSSWTVDEHRNLIASALEEQPIGGLATLAKLDVFLQPELNEAFFCGKLILVEGPEDRAILEAALDRRSLREEFVRLGAHIVPVNGKGGLISMVAIARGFETPVFIMFDADTDCAADAIQGNKKTNTILSKLISLPSEKIAWPDKDVFEDRAIVWKSNIQSAMSAQYPNWVSEVKRVCADWGWQYNRLAKNPAVVSYALREIYMTGKRIECLYDAVDKVMAFARQN